MNRPGNRLRAFAAGWCCPETMERVVDPLIADVQREHGEAVRRRRMWRAQWIQVAGWITFLKVLVVCAGTHLATPERWTADDRKSLVKAAVISVLTTVAITVLLVSRSAEDLPKVLVHPSPKRLFYLAPYPFVAGIVLGVTLGIVLGCRALSRRIVAAAIGAALMCSAIVFINVGWVAPAAHLAYRMTVGDTDLTRLDVGEASFGALRRKIEQVGRDSENDQFGFLVALSYDYHRRVALSFSPLVFTLFALTMAGCFRRRWVPGILACATFVLYGWLVLTVRPWSLQPWWWSLQPWDAHWPPYVAAWCANVTVLVASAAVACVILVRSLHTTRS
jgi:hypothetical protein